MKEPKGPPSPLRIPPLHSLFSRVKDTFLAVIIGQAGQDSSQDPRGVGQHYPARQLDELPHPAHGCKLNQVIWKENWWLLEGLAHALESSLSSNMHKG